MKMRANRFQAAALKRDMKRRKNSAPFARVKNIERIAGGRVIQYTHPTKGHRSRRWINSVPTFASKNDMYQRISYNLGRVMTAQSRMMPTAADFERLLK
jgi:hypothetical protein